MSDVAAEVEHNPYLAGVYAPVHEEITSGDLDVIGEIPADLDGAYLRNGPNPAYEAAGRYHWFDGDGMLHAITFAGGKATYRNRWVRTSALAREREAGAALWSGIMEPPRDNPRDMPYKDTANTDLVFFHNRVLALWYLCGDPYSVHPLTLDTEGKETFDATLPCTVSAHALVDEETGEMMFFDYGPVRPYMRYGVVGPDGRVSHLTDIDLPGPRLPHSMAITPRYSILMDLPLINDPEAMRQGRHKIVFERGMPARFGVIPRHGRGDRIVWFDAEPCYIYHIINAWESGDEIVMDVCRVTRPAPVDAGAGPLAKLLAYLRVDAHVHRYRFDLATGRTAEEQLDDQNIEFPTINMGRVGRPSRYSYNMHLSADRTLLFDGIVKFDGDKQSSVAYSFGPGRWGSEAPFVPRPGAVAEDDGYLVSFVHDEREDRSECVILDAADIEAGPIGRVLLPVRVPLGFHALWVRGDQVRGAV